MYRYVAVRSTLVDTSHFVSQPVVLKKYFCETEKDEFDQAEINARSVLSKYKSKLNQFSDIKVRAIFHVSENIDVGDEYLR